MAVRFDLRHRKHILTQLHKEGQELNDITVMNLLYLLREIKGKEEKIGIVDSVALTLSFKNPRVKKKIQDQIDQPPPLQQVILLPLHANRHWSLLVFLPRLSLYLHLDSLLCYHQRYAREVIQHLDHANLYSQMPYFSNECPEQISDWECGLYLLMNAFMLINATDQEVSSEELLRLYLSRHTKSICEKFRPVFTRRITKIVKQMGGFIPSS